jgi:hypothetical protein
LMCRAKQAALALRQLDIERLCRDPVSCYGTIGDLLTAEAAACKGPLDRKH